MSYSLSDTHLKAWAIENRQKVVAINMILFVPVAL